MHHPWMLWLLFVAMLGSLEDVSGGAGEVWSSARFPKEELGPDNWRYYRVELPPVFSLLTISLSRQWPHDNGSSTLANVPLVCFGFGGPPLPVPPRNSLLEAAISAGARQNVSATGECGWFNDTVKINLTNLEVLSGMLHVGIFSDAKSTRTQSKMIHRGKKFAFALGIQVFWCGTESLGGPDCNMGIGSLPPLVFLKSSFSMNTPLHDEQPILSSRSPKNHINQELDGWSFDDRNLDHATHSESESWLDHPELRPRLDAVGGEDPFNLRNKYLINVSKSGWSNWVSSSQKCIGLSDKQFLSLQILEFVQELEIKYDCVSNITVGVSKCEEFESMVKETRIPVLHLRYGALPEKDMSDFRGEPSTGSIIVSEPKRGWWYLAIFNPMVTSSQGATGKGVSSGEDEMCLTLNWRAKTCKPGQIGSNCQWPVLFLERILQEEVESPFDSYYYPVNKSQSLDHQLEWFSLKSLLNESSPNRPVEQWGFAILKVADGAAGAVLSIDVRTSPTVHTELYARHEGCPTKNKWDFQVTRDGTQGLSNHGGKHLELGKDKDSLQKRKALKYHSSSLSVVYPTEGYWCIGLRYVPRQANMQATELEYSPDPNVDGVQQRIGDWIKRWKLYFTCYEGKLYFLTKHFLSEGTRTMCEGSSVNGLDTRHGNLSSGHNMGLRVTLHGCKDECSGHGSCHTAYEASRLHLISYCHCDVTHGDVDCSAALLGAWKDLRQRTFLIFSNAACILPSIWALRHEAFSEWITFTLSGTASAIYHSCDAGGWCVMSFSTLQFLDFWLSFLVIIMTCLLMAGFSGPSKATLHIGCAVLTAAVAKEDATSGWSILVVVLIGSAGLLLGWGLETQKLSSLRLRWHSSLNRGNAAWLQLCQRLVRSFYVQLRDRFHWPYLWFGLALLLSAILSNINESPKTYWIFHSWWHICIYACAFMLLYSIRAVDGTTPRQGDDQNGYQSVSTTHRQEEDSITDSHEALVLELDSFPESHSH